MYHIKIWLLEAEWKWIALWGTIHTVIFLRIEV